ncbi:thioredoxin [Bacillus coahuilensis p1.1.43]|uniref:Thioredoxin n=1 Tax=Bacillus coahuilensis p1.1.43 TaxID=1150625 RepID=A0A147KB66_9BACI|nr:thioredoxin family protein [Bacillus coahuilensis]KUP08070.1 thioredoxin [Bacillus coahuilensis p1.1.43]
MKKIIIFTLGILILFGAIGGLTYYQNQQAAEGNPFGKATLDASTLEILDDPNYQNVILPDELDEKLENGEEVTVYFYASDCPHCRSTTPILVPITDELGIDMVQYNVKEFEQGWIDYNIEATPTIIHFENGQEVSRLVGAYPEEDLRTWLNSEVVD